MIKYTLLGLNETGNKLDSRYQHCKCYGDLLQIWLNRVDISSYCIDRCACMLSGNLCLSYYLKVEPRDLPDTNSVDKQYVYLVAKSDDAHFQFQKEAKILLSYKDGMVFIQTDKPIYTPRQRGRNPVLLQIESVIKLNSEVCCKCAESVWFSHRWLLTYRGGTNSIFGLNTMDLIDKRTKLCMLRYV